MVANANADMLIEKFKLKLTNILNTIRMSARTDKARTKVPLSGQQKALAASTLS